MKVQLDAYLTSEKMPKIFTNVLVSGGQAYWNGEEWRTNSHRDARPIEWPVNWWIPIPTCEHISELAALEPHDTL
jgi:hypothetical protein